MIRKELVGGFGDLGVREGEKVGKRMSIWREGLRCLYW